MTKPTLYLVSEEGPEELLLHPPSPAERWPRRRGPMVEPFPWHVRYGVGLNSSSLVVGMLLGFCLALAPTLFILWRY